MSYSLVVVTDCSVTFVVLVGEYVEYWELGVNKQTNKKDVTIILPSKRKKKQTAEYLSEIVYLLLIFSEFLIKDSERSFLPHCLFVFSGCRFTCSS